MGISSASLLWLLCYGDGALLSCCSLLCSRMGVSCRFVAFFPAMWSPRILFASWFVFVAAILLAALRDGGVAGEDRSGAHLGWLQLPMPFVAQFSGEWATVRPPLLSSELVPASLVMAAGGLCSRGYMVSGGARMGVAFVKYDRVLSLFFAVVCSGGVGSVSFLVRELSSVKLHVRLPLA